MSAVFYITQIMLHSQRILFFDNKTIKILHNQKPFLVFDSPSAIAQVSPNIAKLSLILQYLKMAPA